MQRFDDELPKRRFDNFQFVCMTEAIKQAKQVGANPEVSLSLSLFSSDRQIGFALQALMEIPEQFQLIRSLKLMDRSVGEKYLKRLHLKGWLVVYLHSRSPLSPPPLTTSTVEIPCVGPPPRPPGGLSLDTTSHSRSFRNQPASSQSPERRHSHATPMSHAHSAPRLIPSFSAPSTPQFTSTDPPTDYLCPISHEVLFFVFSSLTSSLSLTLLSSCWTLSSLKMASLTRGARLRRGFRMAMTPHR
jgi:hypothetical protein